MARQENDREDLLSEATALVERVELTVVGFERPLVAGFRKDGSASIYFGAEPAYHFNSQSELRRGYVQGLLYKTERIYGTKKGRLVSLKRHRVADEVQLLRKDLTADETSRFLDALTTRLTNVRKALEQGRYRIVGQVPSAVNVVERLCDWLVRLPIPIVIASSPRVS
jgi:hypothetical protein